MYHFSKAALLVAGCCAMPIGSLHAQPRHAQPVRSATRSDTVRELPRVGAFAPRIVNGEDAPGNFPTTGFLARRDFVAGSDPEGNCSGFLVGCSTFITAAQCFPPNPAPEDYVVFLQHSGFSDISDIRTHPDWNGNTRTSPDLAVLTLRPAVTGIRPVHINDVQKPPPGVPGLITGFGSTAGAPYPGIGLKRWGRIVTSACDQGSDAIHTCWDFTAPIGPPSDDSTFCWGDIGGGLIVNPQGIGERFAAAFSDIDRADCQADNTSWNPDIFAARQWIASVAGADLQSQACGNLPQAFDADTQIFGNQETLTAQENGHVFGVNVPAGASALRVALNGNLASAQDFDLYVWHELTPTTDFDCVSINDGHSFEYCEIPLPASGVWMFGVDRFAGAGEYQLSASVLGAGPAGACVPNATTLCLDDQPGDARFRAEVYFEATQGSQPSGQAQAIALLDKGVAQGGLFYFTNSSNPEMLLKVLNGCSFNGQYWVFYSAGTNFRFVVRVTDTLTGAEWIDENPDRMLAPPVANLDAFPCA